jgi:hypothetical protein
METTRDGTLRHAARWEPCVNARPRTRRVIALSAEQRSALATYLARRTERREWRYWAIGVAIWMYVALLSRGAFPIFVLGLALGIVTTSVLIALAAATNAALRRESAVMRATGALVVDTRHDTDGGTRSIDIDGQRVVLDDEVHVPREIGGIDYTAKRHFPLAIWDRDGDLIWQRPEYEPAALGADRMGLTA